MLAISKDTGTGRIKAMQAAEEARVQALIERDRPAPTKRKGKKPTQPGVRPTPEWLARYGESQTAPQTESGFKMGRVFHRRPWFESLVSRDWTDAQREKRVPSFTVDDLHALRRYRNAYEAAQRSETRSCLNMERGGGESLGASPSVLRLRGDLIAMEATMGPLITTVRPIAIDDVTYADVAMARFGSREQDHYDDATGAFVRKLAPRSGRHSMLIKAEFVEGVKRLTAGVTGVRVSATQPAVEQELEPERGTPISEAILEALVRRLQDGRGPIGIAAAEWTVQALFAEHGMVPGDAPEAFGLPVSIRADWRFGWVFVD